MICNLTHAEKNRRFILIVTGLQLRTIYEALGSLWLTSNPDTGVGRDAVKRVKATEKAIARAIPYKNIKH